MPLIDFRAARAQVRLAEVLALIDFTPTTRHGDQLRGPCPVHLSKGVWHCFACGAGGNVLDLWAAVTQQPLHAAVLDMYARLHRDVPWLASLRRQPVEKPTMPEP